MKNLRPLLSVPLLAAIAATSLAGTDRAAPADDNAARQAAPVEAQVEAQTAAHTEQHAEPPAEAQTAAHTEPAGDTTASDTTASGAANASAAGGPGEAPSTTETTRLIVDLNAALLNVLQKSDNLDYAQRFALLAPTLQATFDLEYMARQVVGRGFLDLDEESRAKWYELFAAYMTANYASRFDHFANQHFEIIGEDPGAKGTVLVRTRVTEPTKDPVALSYRVRETGATCKVIDVYLKGTVSEIALRRSEYASVLKREGFDALVTSVEARIQKLATIADSSA